MGNQKAMVPADLLLNTLEAGELAVKSMVLENPKDKALAQAAERFCADVDLLRVYATLSILAGSADG